MLQQQRNCGAEPEALQDQCQWRQQHNWQVICGLGSKQQQLFPGCVGLSPRFSSIGEHGGEGERAEGQGTQVLALPHFFLAQWSWGG